MLRHTFRFAAAASLAGTLACTDRPPATAPGGARAPAATARPAAVLPPEHLARALALALRAPEFRAYLKTRLDGSPFREHKLQFQRLLGSDGGRVLQALAGGAGVPAADVAREADSAVSLEMYLPVPEHRRAWTGDPNVLVATAIRDHDTPVAFDVQGNRMLLDPDRPPATPVIALVPVETDFSGPASRMDYCGDACGGGGGGGGGGSPPPPPQPGLYMTQSHFTQPFESWLKGAPEFEVHILGQKDQTDSLKDYQCAGEKKSSPYYFDQNTLDWSGSVLLFDKYALDNYNANHPGKNIRVVVIEDDDEACVIKTDQDLWKNFLTAVDGAHEALTAGKDTTSSGSKTWKWAQALYQLFTALASLINSNDELVGNAVEDTVVGEFHQGFNWIVKGEKDVTNGWIKLEMR